MNQDSQINRDVILLVDDEPSNIKMLNQAVSSLGKVYFASNGEEALTIAKQCLPDVILLDIQMPGMDGYDVCRAIKKDPQLQDAAIIFVTAHTSPEQELKALQYGGVDFLHKPINPIVANAHVKIHLELKKERHQLKLAKRTLNSIIHHLPAFVSYWDENLKNVFCNDIDGHWFGLPSNKILGEPFDPIITDSPNLDQIVAEQLHAAVAQSLLGQTMTFDLSLTPSAGGAFFATAALVPTLIDGEFNGMVMLLNDITLQKTAQQDLHKEKERLNVTLNSIGDAVISTDEKGLVISMNPIAESLTGWFANEAMGQPIEQVMPLVDACEQQSLTHPIYLALIEKRVVGMALNASLRCRDQRMLVVENSAAPILDTQGQVNGAIIVFHEANEARAMALKMSYFANQDPLTHLPKRMLLHDRAERALQNAARKNEKVAMLVLDIDNFNVINDSAGYRVGDRLLQLVSQRLQAYSRGIDTVSRQGGDEFIILLPEVGSLDQVVSYTAQIMASLAESIWIEQQCFNLTCSIGISLYPDDSSDVESLYRHADAAMHRAKQLGRNRWQFFSEEIEANMLSRHKLEQYMRKGLEEGLFEVFYQAKIDSRTHQVEGVEALVRLKGEDGLMISPADFIPLAEDNGLMIPIGQFVMQQAFEDALSWQEQGLNHSVSINLSMVQFAEKDFFNRVEETLNILAVRSDLIEFEVTEGVLAKDAERTRETLDSLKLLGFKIAIDDFGTGYSSLSYLKHLPIDILKIDQSFIRNMLTNASDAAIVDAVIGLGHSLQMRLVAEGVETLEHVDALASKGCHLIQGFYYCKPIPFPDMCQFLIREQP